MSDVGIGLHRDLSFADYVAIPAINSGVVNKWGDVSPLHMHEALAGRIEGTDSADKKFGRGVHCRLLEPERFATEFLVSTICTSQFKDGQACKAPGKHFDGRAWYCGRHKTDDCTEPEDYISIEEGERIEAMAARLHNHPALAMFKRKGWSELSGVYERNGVLCKFRSDRVPEDMDLVIDIKKTQLGKARPYDCVAAICTYGFHVQAAMNVDGIKAHLRKENPIAPEPRFVWVFIEDSHPFGVQVIVASHAMIQDGRDELDMVLEDYARCQKYGTFPDYMADGTRPFEAMLPEWKHKQIQAKKQTMGASA